MVDPTWPPQPAPEGLRPEGLRPERLRPEGLRPERLRPEGLRRVHDAMAARVANGELPGLVTLLARDDEVRVDAIGTYGFDDRPMRRDTPFRLASLTKPVLAALTLRLAQEGLFDLAEPVDRLLPELGGTTTSVRCRWAYCSPGPPVRRWPRCCGIGSWRRSG